MTSPSKNWYSGALAYLYLSLACNAGVVDEVDESRGEPWQAAKLKPTLPEVYLVRS